VSTAGQIIERAFKRILVGAADASPEPDEYADALSDLNSMMISLEADGIRLGYTEVDNVSDVVTVPKGAELGIIANLALAIAPDYNAAISPALGEQARSGMATMRKLGRVRITTSYPGTLPRGSGNEDLNAWDDHYFSPMISALLSLAGNTLTTNIVTADVPVRINAFWVPAFAEGMRGEVYGRITCEQRFETTVTVAVALSATISAGSGAYTFRVMHNGVSVATTAATLSATPADVVISHSLMLYPQDYLEIWVEADAHATDLVVVDGQFEVC